MEKYEKIRKIFSEVTGENLDDISIETAVVPLNEFHHFSFTNHRISLQKRNCGLCEIHQKEGEPFLKITQKDERFYVLLKWEKVLIVKPKNGNLTPLWIPLKEFLNAVNRLNNSSFIRVYKYIVNNGVECKKPNLVGFYLENNFLHDAHGKFFNYKSSIDKSMTFKYVFQRKSPGSSAWVEIPDPRKKNAKK